MRLRRSLGVRPRLIGTLILISAITLAVAAVALLPPLDRRLRADELDSLVGGRAKHGQLVQPARARGRAAQLARAPAPRALAARAARARA